MTNLMTTTADWIMPHGSAAALSNPILHSTALDRLGGVGEYMLPQRGAGVLLGGLAGGYLGGDDHKESGAAIGSGLGYLGAIGADNTVRQVRRGIVENAIDRGIANNTIIYPTLPEFGNDIVKTYRHYLHTFPRHEAAQKVIDNGHIANQLRLGFTSLNDDKGILPRGTIVSGAQVLNDLMSNPNKARELQELFRENKIPRKLYDGIIANVGNIKDMLANQDIDLSSPKIPVLGHELLERHDMLFGRDVPYADASGQFKGKAFDTYGAGINMNHNSMDVLGNEINMANRIMTPKEIAMMKRLRELSGENSTISAMRNAGSMYEGIIPQQELPKWSDTTLTGINRGLESGELLTDAEKRLLHISKLKKLFANAGDKLRHGESQLGDFLLNAISKSKKYLTKAL